MIRQTVYCLKFTLLSVMICTSARASDLCGIVFTSESATLQPGVVRQSDNDEVWAFLEMLVENSDLTLNRLRVWKQALDGGRFENPIDRVEANLSVTKNIYYGVFEKLLQARPVRIEVLRAMALELSARVERNISERAVTTTLTNDPTHIDFIPVEPGRFVVGPRDSASRTKVEVFKPKKARLTNWIEVSSTPITQAQWAAVMGANPAHFANGSGSVVRSYQENDVMLQAMHPVENMTWWSAVVYANQLSRINNLPEVYDLEEIVFISLEQQRGSRNIIESLQSEIEILEAAAKGVLAVRWPEVAYPRIVAPYGDIYQARGYRLITAAEYEYIAQKISGTDRRHSRRYFDKIISAHEWTSDNSDDSTHPVGFRLPLRYKNHFFYDIFGNVLKWTHGFTKGAPGHLGGVNPLDPPHRVDLRSVKGSSFKRRPYDAAPYRETRFEANDRNPTIGLMIVRTVPPPQDFQR